MLMFLSNIENCVGNTMCYPIVLCEVISAVELVIIEVLGQVTLRPKPANGGSAWGIQQPDSEGRIIRRLLKLFLCLKKTFT